MAPADLLLTSEALQRWGEALGAGLGPGDVVALRGDLGAGKTTLAQAIARGFGVSDPVTSPTYALAHRYEGTRGVLWHLDLYRIAGPNDLVALGWDDILSGDAVVVIEWPERAGTALPSERVEIHLASVPGNESLRRLEVT